MQRRNPSKAWSEGPVNALNKMCADMDEAAAKGAVSAADASRFRKEMAGFGAILQTYRAGLESGSQFVDWSKVSTQRVGDIIVPYEACGDDSPRNASKLAVVKLNGGLGTTMCVRGGREEVVSRARAQQHLLRGCTGPKSVIEVRDGKTFLDLIVEQVHQLNKSADVSVPLVLMNSFNTHEETGHIIKRYEGVVKVLSFQQSQHPRFLANSHLPAVETASPATLAQKHLWYPPGHGDVFEALYNSGTLDTLQKAGVEYVFISNVDNLGASVDFRILNKMMETGAEFVMEVTAKTEADVKGGTLVEYEGKVRLLELAQVPKGTLGLCST